MGRGAFIVIEGATSLHEKQIAYHLRNLIHDHTGLTVVSREGSHGYTDDHPQILLQYLAGWSELPDEVAHHIFLQAGGKRCLT